MTLMWVWSLVLRDSSIVDPFWGVGIVVLAWFYSFLTPLNGDPTRGNLLLLLVFMWGLRLSIYLLMRNVQKGKEDPRYAKWRKEAGHAWWWRSYFKVFLLQGALMWLLSTPFVVVLNSLTPIGLTGLDYAAAALWGLGFFFEVVGDWQLMHFKGDPGNHGQVLDRGLWRYTRHPNYFGEALMWWGFGLLAANTGAWWALASPLLMTFLLMRVSGVMLLERDLKQSKSAYADYIKRTSAFFPLPPKTS
jgi:steroid 5-alpha reductase family enzyme